MRRRMLLALLALTLALGCGLSGAAARRGAIDPPELDVVVGDRRLIADLARVPICSQLINPGCVLDHPVPPLRIYTIWVLRRTSRSTWEGAEMRRVMAIRLGPP